MDPQFTCGVGRVAVPSFVGLALDVSYTWNLSDPCFGGSTSQIWPFPGGQTDSRCIYIYLDLQMSRNKCSRCKLLVLQKSARAANEEMQKQVQFSKVRSCALFCARVRNFALEVRP